MIKLKDILLEAESDSIKGWNTPPGTPDAVINVLHLITAVVMNRLGTNKNVSNYVSLKIEEEDIYSIVNSKNNKKISYSDFFNEWFIDNQDMPLTRSELYTIIARWMIEDSLNEGTTVWKTEPGTPNEVIKVGHDIIDVIERDKPVGEDVLEWMAIRQDEFGIWHIYRPRDSGEGRSWTLGYNEENDKWSVYTFEGTSIHGFFPLNSPVALKYVINKWVSGL